MVPAFLDGIVVVVADVEGEANWTKARAIVFIFSGAVGIVDGGLLYCLSLPSHAAATSARQRKYAPGAVVASADGIATFWC